MKSFHKSICAALSCSVSVAVSLAESRPNIIYVLTDDLGWGDVGFNGQKKIRTQFLDRLAAEGAVFQNYYSASPVCGPARASLMTGLHTGHSQIRGNPRWSTTSKALSLDPGTMTVAKELQRAGYATFCIGKWGLNDNLASNTGDPLKQGFDEFFGFNTHGEAHFHWPGFVWHNGGKVDLGGPLNRREKRVYADDLFTAKTVEYIAGAGEKPFFIYLNYTTPHLGITVPEDSQIPYRNLGWPSRVMPQDGHYEYDPDSNVSYAGMVSRLDSHMLRLVDALHSKGLDQNTLIVFSSDNGHEYDDGFFDSNGPFSGGKRSLKEGGIRMPAFAWWPGTVPAGLKVAHLCAFWDVLPTFCELAGIKPSEKTDGISFVPALTGRAAEQPVHEYLYWEFNEREGPVQAVRFGDWKAIRSWNRTAEQFDSVRLYRVDRDLAEADDLSAKYPEEALRALQYMSCRTEHPLYPLSFLEDAFSRGRPD
jgi:arylsulfatase A-like enzyme